MKASHSLQVGKDTLNLMTDQTERLLEVKEYSAAAKKAAASSLPLQSRSRRGFINHTNLLVKYLLI